MKETPHTYTSLCARVLMKHLFNYLLISTNYVLSNIVLNSRILIVTYYLKCMKYISIFANFKSIPCISYSASTFKIWRSKKKAKENWEKNSWEFTNMIRRQSVHLYYFFPNWLLYIYNTFSRWWDERIWLLSIISENIAASQWAENGKIIPHITKKPSMKDQELALRKTVLICWFLHDFGCF